MATAGVGEEAAAMAAAAAPETKSEETEKRDSASER